MFRLSLWTGRWRAFRCQAVGIFLLCIQCVIITLFLFAFLPRSPISHTELLEDASEASTVFTSLGATLFVVGNEILRKGGATRVGWQDRAPFAVQADYVQQIDALVKKLSDAGFQSAVFYNRKMNKFPPKEKLLPIGLAVKKRYPFYIIILHLRTDNFWWYGSVLKDPDVQHKLASVDLSVSDLSAVQKEGIFIVMELQKSTLGGRPMVLPNYVHHWLNLTNTVNEFVECDYERAYSYLKKHKRNFEDTNRFQHKAWKLLSKTQFIMNRLGIPFWLSSGTCLGFYRECGIIPHTTDVDIGVYAKDFSENIVKEFLYNGFYLKHIFGRVNDSYELSFVTGGVKLDMFFFYEEGETVWNGGTQMRTGKKFKYVFPRFDLCWTDFLNLLVRVPCDTATYIEANYGPDWSEPKQEWSWHKSPPNVRENGVWQRDELADVVNVFHAPEYAFP